MTNITSIKRVGENHFIVKTDTAMSDGSYKMDSAMELVGNSLRSFNRPGYIRTGSNMVVTLGPKSLAKVMALNIDETLVYKETVQ